MAEVDAKLARAAGKEMRRPPPSDQAPAKKKKKTNADEERLEVVARYAYDAHDRLAAGTRALVLTCATKNERTATKEALTLLHAYLHDYVRSFATADAAAAPAATLDSAVTATNSANVQSSAGPPAATTALSIAKLACTGVVLMLVAPPPSAPEDAQPITDAGAAGGEQPAPAHRSIAADDPLFLTSAIQRLLVDVESGKRPASRHCLRVVPLEQTSAMHGPTLQARVKGVAAAFLASPLSARLRERVAAKEKVTYAVALKNRSDTGTSWDCQLEGHVAQGYSREAPAPTPPEVVQPAGATPTPAAAAGQSPDPTAGGASGGALQGQGGRDAAAGRDALISLLAAALVHALPDWSLTANLSSPDLVLVCEVLPCPGGRMFAGVTLVPADMTARKQRNYIKVCSQPGAGRHAG